MARNEIKGTTPRDIYNINDNFMQLSQDIFGNSSFARGLERKIRVNSAEIKVQADSISSKVSSDEFNSVITQMSGSISSKVSSAEFASTVTQLSGSISSKVSQSSYNGNAITSLINQSSTTIDIKASKINLSGAVTVLDELSNNLGFINAGRLYGQKVDIDLTNGNFTLNGSGGQVIIDGTSNMFKIYNVYNFNMYAGTSSNYTESIYHGLGYVPAFTAFQVDSPASVSGNTHLPAMSVSGTTTETGGLTFTSIIRATADSNYIYATYIRPTPVTQTGSVKVRIFVYKEAMV